MLAGCWRAPCPPPCNFAGGVRELRSSYRVKQGSRPSGHGSPPSGPGGWYDGTFTADYEFVPGSGDLDECNGRFAATPEHPRGIYHYVITHRFPHIPRYYKGTPDASFARRGPPPGMGARRRPPRHRRPPFGHPPPPFRPRF